MDPRFVNRAAKSPAFTAQGNQADQLSLAEGTQEAMAGIYGNGEGIQMPAQGEEVVTADMSNEQHTEEVDGNGNGGVNGGDDAELILDSLGEDDEIHERLDDGFDNYYKPRRQLDIEDDDVGVVIDHQSWFAQQVFNALRTKPANSDSAQEGYTDKFVKMLNKFHDIKDAKTLLIDVSAMIVKAVIHLHFHGDHLFRHQLLALKPRIDDFEMKATERLNAICNILQGHKKVAMDVMAGADKITTFVAAPMGSVNLKIAYKKSNIVRALTAKNAKLELDAFKEAAEEAVDAEMEAQLTSNVTEEAIVAALQDQHATKKRKRRDGGGL